MHELEIEEALASTMAQAAQAAKDVEQENSKLDEKPLMLSARQAKFLSDVQVPIRVDIGTLSITADELIDLLPGNSFNFSFDPLKKVNLHVGGEQIGTARFIEKEGNLGLEIVSIGE